MITSSRLARIAGSVLLAAVVVAAVSGCGYTVGGSLPSHIRTVGVPIFGNQTSEPGVEALITRAIVEAFSTNGRLQVVPPADADSVLEGEVVAHQLVSIAFDPRANVQQYRLVVRLNVRFRDVRQNRVLFEAAGLEERADFRVAASAADTISLEETALRTAAVDIARAVINAAIEQF
ncbi:MAG: LptE family protein [Candidatus Rokubacteria bacterium]|nr:LptE family protein [Candidatus Rokubacteria bacterium]